MIEKRKGTIYLKQELLFLAFKFSVFFFLFFFWGGGGESLFDEHLKAFSVYCINRAVPLKAVFIAEAKIRF